MRRAVRFTMIALLAALTTLAGTAVATTPPIAMSQPARPANPRRGPLKLTTYPTKYYVICTDLPPEIAREVGAHMTAMAEDYFKRTRNYARALPERLPFFLYTEGDDYHAAGGPAGSIGCYTGKKLLAIAGHKPQDWTWKIIQHEAFHQYVEQVIGWKLPIWMEEGMADYFGEGLWTGDGFATGIVMPYKRWQVRAMIAARQYKPFDQFMALTSAKWQANIDPQNYLQAWSMVQFLAHGEDGKYQEAFEQFLTDVGHRTPWRDAWEARFGTNIEKFEMHWADWWKTTPTNATGDIYAKAMGATLTSFYARAWLAKQSFESMDDFLDKAAAGQLKTPPNDWLPPSLLAERMEAIRWYGHWSVAEDKAGTPPVLHCQMRRGASMTGRFTVKNNRVESVTMDLVAPTTRPDDRPASRPGGNP